MWSIGFLSQIFFHFRALRNVYDMAFFKQQNDPLLTLMAIYGWHW